MQTVPAANRQTGSPSGNGRDGLTVSVPIAPERLPPYVFCPYNGVPVKDPSGNSALAAVTVGKFGNRLQIQGIAEYTDRPGVNNRLILTPPTTWAEIFASDAQTTAKVSAYGAKWLVQMEKEGDFISFSNTPKSPIGVGPSVQSKESTFPGSSLRFDEIEWVPFLGAKYRKGGVSVGRNGLVFIEGTEREEQGVKSTFTDGHWLSATP